MKSIYYQFVNYIQTMPFIWFATINIILFSFSLICVMKFFKKYNGTQKKFEKLSLIISAVLMFAVLVYLTSIR